MKKSVTLTHDEVDLLKKGFMLRKRVGEYKYNFYWKCNDIQAYRCLKDGYIEGVGFINREAMKPTKIEVTANL